MVNFGPTPYGRQPYPTSQQYTAAGVSIGAQGLPLDQAALIRLLDSLVQSGTGGKAGALVCPGMTPAETGVFLKNLLDLPKDIQTLLMLLAFPEEQVTPNALKKMVAQDPDLALLLGTLQKHLGDNVQNGIQKLLKMMTTARMGAAEGGANTVEEMFKFASTMQQQTHASPVSALNTMMLLYLPPLVMPQNIQFRFEAAGPEEEDSGEGGGGGGQKYHLVLFIETATLGKFKVAMGLERSTQIMILMEHDPQSRRVLGPLEKALAKGVAEDGLPPPLFTYLERETRQPMVAANSGQDTLTLGEKPDPMAALETLDKPPQKPDKKVAVFPNEGVSILVVHAAYLLAKLIFQMDDNPPA